MNFSEQIRLLELAQGHPAKLVLAAVDLAFPSQPEVDREMLKEALEAAAVPHWCDEFVRFRHCSIFHPTKVQPDWRN